MIKCVITSTICILGVILCAGTARASEIVTELCDASQGPELTITAPRSDSIVNTSSVKLQGTALRTTQIDIFLDQSYSTSHAIESSGQFELSVSLNKGSNTIELRAYYSCNQSVDTSTLVVTYNPQAAPSSGSDTDTFIPPGIAIDSNDGQEVPDTTGNDTIPPVDLPPTNIQSPTSDTPVSETTAIEDSSTWWLVALVTAALVSPALLLYLVERFASGTAVGGIRVTNDPKLKWIIRSSGLVFAGVLAFYFYGGFGNG